MTSFKSKVGVGLLWIIFSMIVHAMTDASWALCWVVSSAFSYIAVLHYKLDAVAFDLKCVTTAFEIADAELVRVSALANELESDVGGLARRIEYVASEANVN